MFPSRSTLRAPRPLAGLAALVFLAPLALASDDNGHCYLERWVPDDLVPSAKAGTSVAFDGDTAVVGAPGREAAYVYERTGGTWQQVQVLENPGTPDAEFGEAVGVSGPYLVVGAHYDETAGFSAGAVYLYERQPAGWVLEETFLGAPLDNLGDAVDVDDTEELRVAARAYNNVSSVHLFERVGAGWTTRGVLSAPGSASLGAALDLDGDTLVAGDWNDDTLTLNGGAVHHWLVTPAPAPVHYVEKILVPDGTSGTSFGSDVAVDGKNRLVIGARYDDEGGLNHGAVYVYECVPTAMFPFYRFGNPQKIVPTDVGDNSGFGASVDLDGDRIAVGAYNQTLLAASGALHVYRPSVLPGPAWVRTDMVIPDDGLPADFFAYELAIAGEHVLVGANSVDQGVVNGGASYLVSLTRQTLGGGECPCDTLSLAESYGTGKSGTLGVPVLSVNRPPVPGESSLFGLSNVVEGVTPIIFWGNVRASIPFDGGTLLMADPNGEWMPTATAFNQVGIQWQIPALPALCGSEVVFQALFIDPGGWGKFKTAQSNGLHTIVGY